MQFHANFGHPNHMGVNRFAELKTLLSTTNTFGCWSHIFEISKSEIHFVCTVLCVCVHVHVATSGSSGVINWKLQIVTMTEIVCRGKKHIPMQRTRKTGITKDAGRFYVKLFCINLPICLCCFCLIDRNVQCGEGNVQCGEGFWSMTLQFVSHKFSKNASKTLEYGCTLQDFQNIVIRKPQNSK